ncbi:hypothetical protein LTR27_001723 [Elasticomyces elasticus]|nr:hypothetical protein LTR27_001723 [Elasticomyces elasticus]
MAETINADSPLGKVIPDAKLEGHMFRKTTPQLRRAYDRARRNGALVLKVGRTQYSIDVAGCWLSQAETALRDALKGPPRLQHPDTQDVVRDSARALAKKTVGAPNKNSKTKDPARAKRKLSASAAYPTMDTGARPEAELKRQKTIDDSVKPPEGLETAPKAALAQTSPPPSPSTVQDVRKKPITPARSVDTADPELKEFTLIWNGSLPLPEPAEYTDEASFNVYSARQVELRKGRERERNNATARLRTEKRKDQEKKEAKAKKVREACAEKDDEVSQHESVIDSSVEGAETDVDTSDDSAESGESGDEAEFGDEMTKESLLKGMDSTVFKTGTNEFATTRKDRSRAAAKLYPAYLGHVHADDGPRPTGGSTSQEQLKPSAEVRDRVVYDTIYDFPDRRDLVRNVGDRILWHNRIIDQFMSHSISMVFLLQHALGRHRSKKPEHKAKGKGITISFIQTESVRTKQGENAEFYYVPNLMRDIGVLDWAGWSKRSRQKLRAPWYTHEYLTHGPVELDISALRQVPLEDLMAHGLEEYFPALFEDSHEVGKIGLYNGSTHLRYRCFRPSACTPFSLADLDKAAELARLFSPRATDPNDKQGRAHKNLDGLPINLHIFLQFCALSVRPENDDLFAEYIKMYFSPSDAEPLVETGMRSIPNNLPEVMQYMARLREACTALEIPGPRKFATEWVDPNYSYYGIWGGDTEKLKAKVKKSKGPKKAVVKGKKERREDAKTKQIASIAASTTIEDGTTIEDMEAVEAPKQIAFATEIDNEDLQTDEMVAPDEVAGEAGDFVVEELAVA